MYKRQPRLRRPLLHLQRRDTLQICRDLALPIWEDPSNQFPEFSRNRIRQEVLPVLEALHPGSTQRMSDLAERMSQVRDSQTELSQMALKLLQTAAGLDRRGLGALSSASRRLLLAQWLQQQGVPALPASQLEELSLRLESGAPSGAADLAGGWQLSWKGAELVLQQRAAEH